MNTYRPLMIVTAFFLFIVPHLYGQEMQKVVDGNNEFTFSLYDEINNTANNMFFSPYSISSALAMTYNGARNETKEEMAEVFKFSKDQEELSRSFSKLNDHISGQTSKKIQLDIANSIWGQEDYHFEKRFLSLNNKYYGAGVKEVDFKKNYKEIRKQINQWVEDKTQDKIKNLIKKNMLDPLTRMVLVNAIYFNGKWEYPFNKENTYQDKFYVYSECEMQTDFMKRTASMKYHEDDLAQMVEIPYANKSLSMMVILPKKKYGMEELENHLNHKLYQSYQKAMFSKRVNLILPKFKISDDYELNEPLKKLGMKSAFEKDADFSGMTGTRDLFISNVVHKSYVDVNEEGTEAAAATGVVMRKTTAVMETVDFKADHPFIFLIKDNKTNAILFMGRLMKPGK